MYMAWSVAVGRPSLGETLIRENEKKTAKIRQDALFSPRMHFYLRDAKIMH